MCGNYARFSEFVKESVEQDTTLGSARRKRGYLRQPKKEKTWATPKKEHDNANSGRYEKPEGEQKQKAAMKNVCCIKDRRFRRSCAASRLKTKAL